MGKYAYNSSLPFVRANFNGNRISEGRFTNYPYPDPEPSLKKLIKWKMGSNPQRQEKKKDSFKLEPQFLSRLPEEPRRYLIWLGHASFLIRMDDVTILTDPVVGRIPFFKRKAAFPIVVEELKEIDYILISHAHRDHFDINSLNRILKNNPGAELFGPLRIKTLLDKLSIMPIHQEAGWYQQFEVRKKVKIVYLPAIHWHQRRLFDVNEVLWGSFYISDGEKSIYFAGDTAYHKHFKSIQDVMGAADLCLLPIGAYKPDFLRQGANLNPEEAVKAFQQLNGRVMIPMHYGTFDISYEPLGEPMRTLRYLEEQGMVKDQLQVLQPGEIYPF